MLSTNMSETGVTYLAWPSRATGAATHATLATLPFVRALMLGKHAPYVCRNGTHTLSLQCRCCLCGIAAPSLPSPVRARAGWLLAALKDQEWAGICLDQTATLVLSCCQRCPAREGLRPGLTGGWASLAEEDTDHSFQGQ